ncbi:hypothetical protein [Amphritea sp.]|uniref:PHP domain-containing protein n=1 Tax=Amphritea sp. TaxID=1872502 RepID=UPI003D0E00EA
MKIDIHVHTKKSKQGDAHSREIDPERFAEVVQSTNVEIIAITNHNIFDLEQFNMMEEQLGGAAQIWPGIELDVVDDDKRSHLIVLVSPDKRDEFSELVDKANEKYTPDDFTISLENTVAFFNDLDPIYIAHYLGKKPDMGEASIEKLLSLGVNSKRVIKEATNSISAGIFIAHGHTSIYGSDIQDWDNYSEEADRLPELRLPVESFEHFCLLLEKDISTIDTAIQRKHSETLKLQPFEDATQISIKAFNDINVFFGPKGTGKTKILEAIARHYSSNGIRATVFESAPDKLADRFDLLGKNIEQDVELGIIDDCKAEISRIKGAKESDITSLYKYRDYFNTESKNKNAKIMKIKDIPSASSEASSKKFGEYTGALSKVEDMIEFITSNIPVIEVTNQAVRTKLLVHLSAMILGLKGGSWNLYSDWKSAELINSASNCFRNEISRKTGALSKPTETGFKRFARNRLSICRDVQKIYSNIEKVIENKIETVGSLGIDKGYLECVTSFKLHDGMIRDSRYIPIKSLRKGDQKSFVNVVRVIKDNAFSDNLFDYITELNSIEEVGRITVVSDLLLFWRRFTLGGEEYSPSNGECSMLNLHSELAEDKEIYILDEPERSLGNEYINDVIIPLINDKAKLGKKVFISTHDANIAVRTLPYNSIYRCHDENGYETYVGNPFSNNLVCLENQNKILDWKQTSMKTLEGGESAFGERGKIYGSR